MTTPVRKPLFSSDRSFDILLCLGLVLAIFIPYHQVAGHRFIEFDDGIYAYYNLQMMRGLSWDRICWAFTNTEAANWHPLTWISYLIDRELFGSHPGGYLLENVVWHACAAVLCYVAFLKVTKRRLFAFVVALIFAVHPVNVENVAWLSERKSLLNAVCWFAAISFYVDFLETRSRRAYGLTVIAHLLGLMFKSMSVTLPATLVLVHVLRTVYQPASAPLRPFSRSFLKEYLLPVVPLGIVSLYFSVVTIWAQSTAMAGVTGFPLSGRLINVALAYERYVLMFFRPTELAIFYPLFQSELTWRGAIPALLLLAAISAVTLLLVRRKPLLLVGWCWFLGTMAPVCGLVQVGSQSHADRYLYVPMIGLAFVFPALFEELRVTGTAVRRALAGTFLAAYGVSMIAATQVQVSYWQDGVTLFQHALSVTGNCVTSVANLAIAYHRLGRYRDMITFADSAIAAAQNPLNVAKLNAMKASAYYNLENRPAAMEWALKAIDQGYTTDAATFMILAGANYDLGKLDKAAEYVAKARQQLRQNYESDYVGRRLEAQIAQLENDLKAKRAPGAEHRPPPAGPAGGASSAKPAT